MLLMSPSDAAQAIGAKCGGAAPSDDDAELIVILNLITAKVTTALGVKSLVSGVRTDRFHILNVGSAVQVGLSLYDRFYDAGDGQWLTLRLNNGFVVDGTVQITKPDGTLVSDDPTINVDIDYEQGLVSLDSWVRGVYTIVYQAGFEPTPAPYPAPGDYDPNSRVLQCVPDWMKLIVVSYLVQWFRTVQLTPRLAKGMTRGIADLANTLDRQIHSVVYGHYQRPRMGVVWGDAR